MTIPDPMTVLSKLAENGHAPNEGCSLFGTGYEDAFSRLKEQYLRDQFDRGQSSEKFVFGPYGSGKTHFLRHFLEIASNEGCVTSEMALSAAVDMTDSLAVYKQISQNLLIPGGAHRGILALLQRSLDNVRNRLSCASGEVDDVVLDWIEGIRMQQFEQRMFGRIMSKALKAVQEVDLNSQELCIDWLSGEISDRGICRDLGIPVTSKRESGLFGTQALYSLSQFIRAAQFRGTVIAFDEGEQQNVKISRKKLEEILSFLQSGINSVSDLKEASLLVFYAFTPNIADRIRDFAALQMRIAEPPVSNGGFFAGNTYASRIDLRDRPDPRGDLSAIGRSLAEFFYTRVAEPKGLRFDLSKEEVDAKLLTLAGEIVDEDPSISNRRDMVKGSATILCNLYSGRPLNDSPYSEDTAEEDEV